MEFLWGSSLCGRPKMEAVGSWIEWARKRAHFHQKTKQKTQSKTQKMRTALAVLASLISLAYAANEVTPLCPAYAPFFGAMGIMSAMVFTGKRFLLSPRPRSPPRFANLFRALARFFPPCSPFPSSHGCCLRNGQVWYWYLIDGCDAPRLRHEGYHSSHFRRCDCHLRSHYCRHSYHWYQPVQPLPSFQVVP
jgi:hypothetical protein